MNIDDYKRLHEAIGIPSQGTGSPFSDPLAKMFDEIVRLECEWKTNTRIRSWLRN